MFKKIFSFSGRIRRLEYGLTYILSILLILCSSLFLEISQFVNSAFTLLIFIIYWIILAQGAKRCHDIGNSGFYQLIPFYAFVLLFAEGEDKKNKYGHNPKNEEPIEKKETFKLTVLKKLTHIKHIEIITISMFIALILSINNLIFSDYDSYLTLSYFFMPIPGFIVLLLISYYKKSYPKEKSNLTHQQLAFSVYYYLVIRLYNIVFRLTDFNFETILFEFMAIVFIFGLTFISLNLYSFIFKPYSKDV